MNIVVLQGDHADPIVASHAIRFHERLLGRWSPNALEALLISASSVHTFGLKEPIGVIGLDKDMTVMGNAILGPNRLVWFRGAKHILEVPVDFDLPNIGDCLKVSHV
jgi:hypothetical protein